MADLALLEAANVCVLDEREPMVELFSVGREGGFHLRNIVSDFLLHLFEPAALYLYRLRSVIWGTQPSSHAGNAIAALLGTHKRVHLLGEFHVRVDRLDELTVETLAMLRVRRFALSVSFRLSFRSNHDERPDEERLGAEHEVH